MNRPVRIFYSYADKDDDLQSELEEHLTLLEHAGLVTAWSKRRVLPGMDWKAEIDQNLNQADIILLLISSSLLASRYCWGVEVARAIEREREGSAKVIPVFLRPVDWQHFEHLGKLQSLPRNGIAITSSGNRDEVWTQVARELRQLIEEFQAKLPTLLSVNPWIVPQAPAQKLKVQAPTIKELDHGNFWDFIKNQRTSVVFVGTANLFLLELADYLYKGFRENIDFGYLNRGKVIEFADWSKDYFRTSDGLPLGNVPDGYYLFINKKVVSIHPGVSEPNQTQLTINQGAAALFIAGLAKATNPDKGPEIVAALSVASLVKWNLIQGDVTRAIVKIFYPLLAEALLPHDIHRPL